MRDDARDATKSGEKERREKRWYTHKKGHLYYDDVREKTLARKKENEGDISNT